jgi:hypothetical protein
MKHRYLLLFLPLLCSFDRLGIPKGKGSASLEEPHVVTVSAPDHGKADKFDAAGWYARVTVELEGEGTLVARRGEATARAAGGPGRLALHLPAELLGEGLTLELTGTGPASGLAVERFHHAPTRKLVGKANGHLGPDLLASGALGFTGLTEHKHRAFSILDVRADGPAARAGLAVGDLVVAVEGAPLAPSSIAPGWDWFERSHEATLGRALEAAWGAGRDSLTLTVWRDGATEELTLTFTFPAALDGGFPLEGPLAAALHADLLRWTVAHQRDNGSWPGTDAVNPMLGGLALLGTRDPAHVPAIERCVAFLRKKNPKPSEMSGLAYWPLSFQGMLFCELYLARGDEDLLPWIEEAAAWLPTTTHTCKWGMQAFGHGPSGLPYDNKALMACTAHLLVFDALARRCGVESRVWEHIQEYVVHSWSDPEAGGHGAMGYNGSYKDKNEFWSRSGLTAMATALRGESGTMRERLCVIMEERHPWMLNSHAYGEPGAALGLMGLAVAHPPSFEAVLPLYRWRFLNAWEPGFGLRYSTPHMGAPYMGGESILNLSYAVLFSAARGGLVITGGDGARWLEARGG